MSDKKAREAYILNRLARDGSLSVAALSRDLGVSEVTIRSNLRELEGRGLLLRTHGGAQASTFQSVLERQRNRLDEKGRIAAAAAALVRDGDCLMIEAGTTTGALAKELTGRQGLQIVTNSTLTFAAARLNSDLGLVLTGGTFHHESESMVGSRALATIAEYNARLAFVGTDGFTGERGLTTQFAEGADVIRAMHARAEETWLLADSTKYGRAGFVSVLPLAEVAGVVTDSGLGEESVEALESLGVRVILA
ncbi:MAG: DeoR/GlpR family DNA-binding transcription regulator [Actinobacteria bacterium]|nr:DeoR/GlpR family DNA-binding transcription regulator [Actinomycetota bacterium]